MAWYSKIVNGWKKYGSTILTIIGIIKAKKK